MPPRRSPKFDFGSREHEAACRALCADKKLMQALIDEPEEETLRRTRLMNRRIRLIVDTPEDQPYTGAIPKKDIDALVAAWHTEGIVDTHFMYSNQTHSFFVF